MILAPLRGVTIAAFRETFAAPIEAAGFDEAITPFIPAMVGYDPLRDRELRGTSSAALLITPQFIGKDPQALRGCLERVKAAGFATADLNCGCPYPMVRNKGRGSGLLRTPEVLRGMLEVGCEVMGAGKFSLKTRLGIEQPDELLSLMPLINQFPLRFLTVHGRVAKAMYEGAVDSAAMVKVVAASRVPVVLNGDFEIAQAGELPRGVVGIMVGRSFIRSLGEREDIGDRLCEYIEVSVRELSGDHAVLGRLKELIAYWRDLPRWHRRWQGIKLCRTIPELLSCLTPLRVR